jgi:hypothetical protein
MLQDTKKLLLLVLFILLFACSQSEPEISYGSLELVYYENGGNPVERFSFFVLSRDNDGIEDLDELWLYHDWDGLSWRLTSGDWISQIVDGNTGIGTRAISMVDNSPLPRGQFRAVLVDKGGSRSERFISFDAPLREREFPHLDVTGNRSGGVPGPEGNGFRLGGQAQIGKIAFR